MARPLAVTLVIPACWLIAACAFDNAKPPASAEGALAGRWCRPSDVDATLDGHALAARWTVATGDAGATVMVARTFDGVLFERQTWELGAEGAGAPLARRTIETPEVLSAADEALVKAHPLDDLQALADRADPWATALIATRGAGEAACDVLPSAYGHGYPTAEGWYVAGAQTAAGTSGWDSGWYGHGGEAAAAPFAVARSRLIVVTYDDAERMTEEWLDRGASDGGPHDLMRSRAFGAGGLLEDRIERWSPTPKEDVLRVLAFADEGPTVVRRALSDTWEQTLDVRFIPRPR